MKEEQLNENIKIVCADSLEYLKTIPNNSIDLVVTSPSYYTTQHKYQRGSGFHYDIDVGEPLYVIEDISQILFEKVKDSGAFALNLGFSYGETGIMRPFRIIERLLRFGWFPFDIVIWHKNNPIPIRTRLTNSIEYIFILTKKPDWKYPKKINYEHNHWEFPVESKDWGTASFPIELPKRCIELLSRENDLILDPFMGSGTTLIATIELERKAIGIDISEKCYEKAKERIKNELNRDKTV